MGYQVRIRYSNGVIWVSKRTYKTKAGAEKEAMRTRGSGMGKYASSIKVVRV